MVKSLCGLLVLMLALLAVTSAYCQNDYPDSDLEIVKVVITPDQVALMPGTKVRFRFTALNARGQEVPAAFNWAFSGGSLRQDGVYGIYTAGRRPGKYTLEAAVSTGIKNIAHITIRDPGGNDKQVDSVHIEPRYIVMQSGQTYRFVFYACNRSGKRLRVPFSISYSGGQLDSQGNYQAGDRPGTYNLKVKTPDGRQATAEIVIIGANDPLPASSPQPRCPRVEITPSQVTLNAGQQCRFAFKVYDAAGNDVAAALQISVRGGELAQDGTFTAGAVPGTYNLEVATPEGVSGKAVITIKGKKQPLLPEKQPVATTPGPCVDFRIFPRVVRLQCGEKCQFEFIGYDAQGRKVRPAMQIRFAGGKLLKDGSFVAGNVPGHYHLEATSKEGLRAVVKIEVIGERPQQGPQHGPLTRLILSPRRIRLRQGGKCNFSFKALDAQGRNVTNAQLSWSYRGGRLQNDGSFQAGWGIGQYYITLSSSNKVNSRATVFIMPASELPGPDLWLELYPDDVTLRPGETCRFRYYVTDGKGHRVKAPPMRWKHLGGSFDPDKLLFTAGAEPGNFYLEAILTDLVQVRAAITIR